MTTTTTTNNNNNNNNTNTSNKFSKSSSFLSSSSSLSSDLLLDDTLLSEKRLNDVIHSIRTTLYGNNSGGNNKNMKKNNIQSLHVRGVQAKIWHHANNSGTPGGGVATILCELRKQEDRIRTQYIFPLISTLILQLHEYSIDVTLTKAGIITKSTNTTTTTTTDDDDDDFEWLCLDCKERLYMLLQRYDWLSDFYRLYPIHFYENSFQFVDRITIEKKKELPCKICVVGMGGLGGSIVTSGLMKEGINTVIGYEKRKEKDDCYDYFDDDETENNNNNSSSRKEGSSTTTTTNGSSSNSHGYQSSNNGATTNGHDSPGGTAITDSNSLSLSSTVSVSSSSLSATSRYQNASWRAYDVASKLVDDIAYQQLIQHRQKLNTNNNTSSSNTTTNNTTTTTTTTTSSDRVQIILGNAIQCAIDSARRCSKSSSSSIATDDDKGNKNNKEEEGEHQHQYQHQLHFQCQMSDYHHTRHTTTDDNDNDNDNESNNNNNRYDLVALFTGTRTVEMFHNNHNNNNNNNTNNDNDDDDNNGKNVLTTSELLLDTMNVYDDIHCKLCSECITWLSMNISNIQHGIYCNNEMYSTIGAHGKWNFTIHSTNTQLQDIVRILYNIDHDYCYKKKNKMKMKKQQQQQQQERKSMMSQQKKKDEKEEIGGSGSGGGLMVSYGNGIVAPAANSAKMECQVNEDDDDDDAELERSYQQRRGHVMNILKTIMEKNNNNNKNTNTNTNDDDDDHNDKLLLYYDYIFTNAPKNEHNLLKRQKAQNVVLDGRYNVKVRIATNTTVYRQQQQQEMDQEVIGTEEEEEEEEIETSCSKQQEEKRQREEQEQQEQEQTRRKNLLLDRFNTNALVMCGDACVPPNPLAAYGATLACESAENVVKLAIAIGHINAILQNIMMKDKQDNKEKDTKNNNNNNNDIDIDMKKKRIMKHTVYNDILRLKSLFMIYHEAKSRSENYFQWVQTVICNLYSMNHNNEDNNDDHNDVHNDDVNDVNESTSSSSTEKKGRKEEEEGRRIQYMKRMMMKKKT